MKKAALSLRHPFYAIASRFAPEYCAFGAHSKGSEFYKSIVQDQTEMICRFGRDGELTFMNEPYAKYLGKGREELLGTSFIGFLPKEAQEGFKAYLGAFNIENPFHVSERQVEINGEVRWQQWVDRALYTKGGQFIEFQSVGRDITGRKITEQALKRSEEGYQSLIQTIPDLIYKLDPEGKFTFVNNGVETLGYSPEELIGRHFSVILHPEDAGKVSREAILSAPVENPADFMGLFDERRTGARMTRKLNVRLVHKDWKNGSNGTDLRHGELVFWSEVEASGSYANANGGKKRFIGTIGIAKDITELVVAKESLQKAGANLRHTVEERTAELARSNEELKQSELAQKKSAEVFQDLNNAFLSLGVDYQVNLDVLTKVARQVLNADSVLYNRIVGRELWAISGSNIPDGYDLKSPVEGRICTDVINGCGRKPDAVVLENLGGTKYAKTDSAVSKYGLKTYVGHPVLCGTRPMGSICAVYSSEHDVTGVDQEVVGLLATAIGIEEERKLAHDMLIESESKFRALVENSLAGIYILNKKDEIAYCNPKFAEMCGMDEKAVLGRALTSFLHEEDRANVMGQISDSVRNRSKLREHAFRIRQSGAEDKYVETMGTKIQLNGENLLVGVMIDVSSRKRMESSMIQSQKLESVGKLAGGIAHEFNNLLSVVAGNAQLVQLRINSGSYTPDSLLGSMDSILSASERATTITQQIIGFARQGKYAPDSVDLNSIAAESSELLSKGFSSIIPYNVVPLLKAKNAIYADAAQVHQVIQNLAINSRDSMANGGTITISTEDITTRGMAGLPDNVPEGEYVRLTVSDSGIGISRKELGNIFDPFYTTKGPGNGTGLGLASVWGISRNHNALIQVESEEGKGTAFSVYFPALKAKQANVESAPVSSSKRPRKVLVVDDEKALRDVLAEFLEMDGFEVEMASDGNEALEKFRINAPDAVLTDVLMSPVNGLELLKQLKAIDSNARVYLMSGYSADSAIKEAISSGSAAGFFQKPFNFSKIIRCVSDALEEGIMKESKNPGD